LGVVVGQAHLRNENNIPDKLRSIDSIKRPAGMAMHPTKGINSIPDLV
jgi:hypothetical protein